MRERVSKWESMRTVIGGPLQARLEPEEIPLHLRVHNSTLGRILEQLEQDENISLRRRVYKSKFLCGNL